MKVASDTPNIHGKTSKKNPRVEYRRQKYDDNKSVVQVTLLN